MKRISSYLAAIGLAAAVSGGAVLISNSAAQADKDSAPAGEVQSAEPTADAAEFGTCDELADAFTFKEESNRVYDPEERTLVVAIGGRSYAVDVDDRECLGHPVVATVVEQVLALQRENDESECRSSVKELSAMDPKLRADPDGTIETEKGTLHVAPYVKYAKQLCAQFGVEVPQ